MKVRPVGSDLSHADRQIYDEASSHFFFFFCNFGILQTRVKTAYAAISYDHIY